MIRYATVWPWPLKFWPWSVVIHGHPSLKFDDLTAIHSSLMSSHISHRILLTMHMRRITWPMSTRHFLTSEIPDPDLPIHYTSRRASRLGSVTARHSSIGSQPDFAALNWGRYLYSAGPPSRWALAHISSLSCFFFLLLFYSSHNLSGRRLDVYHTSTHGVALVRI